MKMLFGRRSSYFASLIVAFTILSVVLISSVGGYLYTQATRLMTDEIARESQSRLVSTMDYVEQSLLKMMEDKLEKHALSTTVLQQDLPVQYLLDNGWQDYPSYVLSVARDLELLRKSMEGVQQVTVYFRDHDFVVDNSRFYMTAEHSSEGEFIRRLDAGHTRKWMRRTLATGEDVLTYAVKLPYAENRTGSPKGYLFADIGLTYIEQALGQMISSPLERFYIFDEDGELLIHSTDTHLSEVELLRDVIYQNEALKQMADGNANPIVLSQLDGPLSKYHWRYAMVRPNDSFVLSSAKFRTKIFATCGMVLLLGLLISYLISRQFYMPMRRLVQLVQSARHPNGMYAEQQRSSEYTIIGNALNRMEIQIMNLESIAEKNEVKNLVLGASLESEAMDRLPQNCKYIVAMLQFADRDAERFETYFESRHSPILCRFVNLNPQSCAIIYFIRLEDHAGEQEIAEELQLVREQLGNDIRFRAAVGAAAESAQGIPLSYQASLHALRYHFISGPEAIILYSDVLTYSPLPEIFAYDAYANMLKAGNVEGASRFINECYDVLKSQKLQLEAVELALLQFMTIQYQVVVDLKLEQLIPSSSLLNNFKKETLAETIEVIRDVSDRIATHARDSSSHAHVEIMYKLKRYIDEHLQDDLSLNVLSDIARLAPSYISTLFGEVMGVTFSEYMTNKRLEKAGQLLSEESRLTITQIADLVGYRNPQYFHNKFKAHYGITPAQYRTAHRRVAAEQSM